jgi:regulatory protein
LARREHSTTELLHKLSKKNFSPKEIDTVLAVLSQENLLSDARFTESFIHYRRGMGYGPLYIQAELKQKGVKDDIIQDYLQITDNLWIDSIQDVWRKKFKGCIPSDFKNRAKQMRFLHYRGFTQPQINSLFDQDR